jgi:pyridoxal 5'-phosphate synthase pdxT subunit
VAGKGKKVGVLALQGDYAAHGAALERAGAAPFELRSTRDIEVAEAFVLPGGESTVIGGLLVRFGLMEALVAAIGGGKPVLGTCAGLILLAAKVEGREQPGLSLLDITVQRNAYGRQVDSFRERLRSSIPGAEGIEAVYIRAPRITALGAGVEVLAERPSGEPVLVRQGSMLGATFHPELVESLAVQRYFLEM